MPNTQLTYPPMQDVEATSRHRRFQKTALYGRVFDMGDVSGAVVVDLRRSNVQTMRLVGNVASLTLVKPPGVGNFRLWIHQDGTGGRTVGGWDADLDWGGTAPVVPGGADKYCIVVVEREGGSVYAAQMARGVDDVGFG